MGWTDERGVRAISGISKGLAAATALIGLTTIAVEPHPKPFLHDPVTWLMAGVLAAGVSCGALLILLSASVIRRQSAADAMDAATAGEVP